MADKARKDVNLVLVGQREQEGQNIETSSLKRSSSLNRLDNLKQEQRHAPQFERLSSRKLIMKRSLSFRGRKKKDPSCKPDVTLKHAFVQNSINSVRSEPALQRSSTTRDIVSPWNSLPYRRQRASNGCLKILTQDESLLTPFGVMGFKSDDSDLSAKVEKTVSLGSVDVHSYTRMLGDNPSVSSGPPIALGRILIESEHYELAEFEAERENDRRWASELLLTRMQREDLLKEAGYSRGDFAEAEAVISKIRAQRLQSTSKTLAQRAWNRIAGVVRRKEYGKLAMAEDSTSFTAASFAQPL